MRKGLIFSFFLISYTSNCQFIDIKSEFIASSFDIGIPTVYAIGVKHNGRSEIFFPDTNYQTRTSFKILKKTPFNTKKLGKNIFLDSLQYEVVSYSTDSIQYLQLPIFLQKNRDCTLVISPKAAINLNQLVKKDSLFISQFKSDTSYHETPTEFNFYTFIFIVFLLISFVIITQLFLGKRIIKQIKLWKMRQTHQEYIKQIQKPIQSAQIKASDIGQAIAAWKSYMEILEKKPFSTYTTKEIIEYYEDNFLISKVLKDLDSVIYGSELSKKSLDHLKFLILTVTNSYEDKRENLRKNYTD